MAILELLHERPMHPYEMAQLMRERHVDFRVKLRPGSLYHAVERLEGRNLIEIVDTQRQGRRPERTVYAVTDFGRDLFAEQARTMLSTPATEYPEYLVALSAASELTQDDAVIHLRLRIVALKARIAGDEALAEQVKAHGVPAMYWIDHVFAHHQRESELEWTQRLVADLESGRIPWPKPTSAPELSLVDKPDKETGNAKTG